MRTDVVSKLKQYLNEDPEDKPSWWNDECKQHSEGALLCLLMTGVSEPGVVKWFNEKFVSVVCYLKVFLTQAKCKEMAEEDT